MPRSRDLPSAAAGDGRKDGAAQQNDATRGHPTKIHEDPPPYRAVAAVCDRRAEAGRRSQSAATGSGAGAPLRFTDLFCGIGGFRLALEKAGGKC